MTKILGHCTEKDFRTKEYEAELEFFLMESVYTFKKTSVGFSKRNASMAL